MHSSTNSLRKHFEAVQVAISSFMMKQKCDKIMEGMIEAVQVIFLVLLFVFNCGVFFPIYVQSGYSCTNSRSGEEFKDNGRND